jgi:endonuclease YncB( thermonuclease family)
MCLALISCWFSNKYSYLATVEYKDTKPFVVPISCGKVVKVYDGDTITIAAKLPDTKNSAVYRFQVRLNGIDSPEIKGGGEHEKELAKNSRDELSKLIMGKIVDLKNVSTEKYGRVLADVYYGDVNVCEWMLENGYAVKYDGGTKHRPDEWSA